MDRRTVIAFNTVYAAEPTDREKQLVNELLAVWGRFETAAAKTPAIYRKGIFFGLALQKALTAGRVLLPEVKAKRKDKTEPEQLETERK